MSPLTGQISQPHKTTSRRCCFATEWDPYSRLFTAESDAEYHVDVIEEASRSGRMSALTTCADCISPRSSNDHPDTSAPVDRRPRKRRQRASHVEGMAAEGALQYPVMPVNEPKPNDV